MTHLENVTAIAGLYVKVRPYLVPIGSKHDLVMAHKLNTLYMYAFNHIDSVLISSELQPIQK